MVNNLIQVELLTEEGDSSSAWVILDPRIFVSWSASCPPPPPPSHCKTIQASLA